MPSAATVHGQTLGPDGAPVPGALLTLFAFSSTGETQSEVGRLASDRSGSFQFRRLHPGTAYQMRVEAAGLRTRYSRPFRLGEARDLRLDQRLSAGTTLTGRILRPDGEPIIGAVLQAVDQHSGQYVGRSRTDEKGAFRFDSLTEGPFGVSAFAPGYTEISLGDVRAGSDLALEMTLERTVSLEVDLPQDYHFEYWVKLFRLGTDSDHPTLSQSFPPNQRRHTLGPLPEGRYKLVAEGPGLTPAHIETIRALGEGGQVQYLQLRLGRMIVGTLVDSDGQPINGAYILRGQVPANVSSREAQSRGLILEATHPDGSFHLTGFEGAQARITIMHDEYLTQTVNVNVGQSTSNRIQLVRGHLLKVQLTGSALSARQLRLEGPVVRETLSNPTGEAHFAGLMPGSYTIRIDGKPVKHSAIEIPKLTSIQLASSK